MSDAEKLEILAKNPSADATRMIGFLGCHPDRANRALALLATRDGIDVPEWIGQIGKKVESAAPNALSLLKTNESDRATRWIGTLGLQYPALASEAFENLTKRGPASLEAIRDFGCHEEWADKALDALEQFQPSRWLENSLTASMGDIGCDVPRTRQRILRILLERGSEEAERTAGLLVKKFKSTAERLCFLAEFNDNSCGKIITSEISEALNPASLFKLEKEELGMLRSALQRAAQVYPEIVPELCVQVLDHAASLQDAHARLFPSIK